MAESKESKTETVVVLPMKRKLDEWKQKVELEEDELTRQIKRHRGEERDKLQEAVDQVESQLAEAQRSLKEFRKLQQKETRELRDQRTVVRQQLSRIELLQRIRRDGVHVVLDIDEDPYAELWGAHDKEEGPDDADEMDCHAQHPIREVKSLTLQVPVCNSGAFYYVNDTGWDLDLEGGTFRVVADTEAPLNRLMEAWKPSTAEAKALLSQTENSIEVDPTLLNLEELKRAIKNLSPEDDSTLEIDHESQSATGLISLECLALVWREPTEPCPSP